MKTLVSYFSQTGNTKRVADAIYGEINGEKELKELGDVGSLWDYDLAFIGFPIHAFGPAQPAKDFLQQQAKGKKVALFITHAAPEGEEGIEDWLNNCRKAASDAELVGMFDCQGELDQNTADFLLKSDNPMFQEFGARRPDTLGQPDESRLARAREYAREIMDKVGV
ncbi:MAG: flavodoxin family protein [Actinomycetota bacterium]|nr:flavodoxin family protein [Actinomycetota bacterium]